MPSLDTEIPPALMTLQPLGGGPQEQVAVEMPVALTVNEISQAVMLATPADLEDFALGFALSEGWVRSRRDLLDVDVLPQPGGIELALRVTAACEQHLKTRRRLLAGRTGCGLCGLESLAQVGAVQPAPVQPPALAAGALDRALAGLHSAQALNAHCGGLHGAAWCSPDGELLLAREDIGRHNALDKLAGALARSEVAPRNGFVLMSSRASFELVHKTAMAGIGLLACVSAPSSLAIETAQRLGLQLWAFVREGRATRYT